MAIIIPTDKLIGKCDCEKFVVGLNELAQQCNVSSVTYNQLGITKIEFADGSSIGGLRLWKDAGIIKGEF